MDALKKAQQLHLKESEGIQMLKYLYSAKKRGEKFEIPWAFFSTGLISLCIFLIVLLKPASQPLATQLYQNITPIEGNPSTHVSGKPPAETPWESLIKQRPDEKELNPEKKEALENSLPTPLTSQKEEPSSKSIGIEQEGGKDVILTLEVLKHFNSGVHFYNQREFLKAIQAYQKVIELDPSYVEAYNNLGFIYQMLGDEDRAFGFYQKSTEINPKYEKGYNNLGILLLFRGRYEEGQEVFQKAVAINSNNIESHINLGILFKKKGEREKAIESYRKALAINPLHSEIHYNIALLYEQLENMEMAITHYQQFIRLSLKSHPDLVSKVLRHLNALAEARRNIGK